MTAVTNLALILVPFRTEQPRGGVGRARRVNTETAFTPVWKNRPNYRNYALIGSKSVHVFHCYDEIVILVG